jgi:hypothetical protein
MLVCWCRAGSFKVALLVVVQIRLKNLGVGLVAIGHKKPSPEFHGFRVSIFCPHSFHHVLAQNLIGPR